MSQWFHRCLALLLLAGMARVAFAQSADVAPIEFDPADYRQWRDHILPTEAELQFYKIPWERTFGDGVLRADQLNKPILLWAMNGHPLGCT